MRVTKVQGQAIKAPVVPRRAPRLAFLFAVPIGILGGLIGLGGAEFRLPVLVGPLGYSPRKAVPLNLAISLCTIVASLAIRSRTLSLDPLRPLAPSLLALIAGAVLAAFAGTALVHRLSDERLERIILVILVVIGCALIVEGFLPEEVSGFLPEGNGWRIPAGVLFGLGIGLVSSLLGVAGGEVIIPTLVLRSAQASRRQVPPASWSACQPSPWASLDMRAVATMGALTWLKPWHP